MCSDFYFWLMQQPQNIQFWYYLGMVIILVVCIVYSILQEPKEE